MTNLVEKLGCWPTTQFHKLEQHLCHSRGQTVLSLMEAAGKAAFDIAIRHWPNIKHCLVLCGTGNNGGDGYVFARLAQQAGITVTLISVSSLKSSPEPAATVRQLWLASGGKIVDPVNPWPKTVDLVVDALLGTGIRDQLKPELIALIKQVNAHSAPCLALDTPSGLDPDKGTIQEIAIKADITLSFIALKPGLITGQGPAYRGKLLNADLGLAHSDAQLISPIAYLTAADLSRWLLPRKPTAHKGNMGKLLLVGGNKGTAGAIRLAGEGALRSGAGLVRVLTHASNLTPLLASRPELMCDELDKTSLSKALDWADIIAIGPGLGLDDWGRQALEQVRLSEKSMVWDADALNFLAIDGDKRQNRLLTPHPGEAARLLGISVQAIEADRLTAARRLVEQYGGVVVLKGAGTIIASEQGQLAIADVGNPGMASGGMGDLLTGVITAFLGQQLDLWSAACAGVVAHGTAADRDAARNGARGMLASDLVKHLRYVINPDL